MTAPDRKVVEYDPAEMVLTVRAGATWDEVDALLAPNRQRLGVRPALPAGRTIGALVATDSCGPHRHRFGSWRDQVLGLGLLLADGREIRAGGKVVKNVAGYDLCKLVVGSFGSIGEITELSLRLHPRPEVAIVGRLGASDAVASVERIRDLPVEPASLLASVSAGHASQELAVAFEGRPATVEAQRKMIDAGVARDWKWHADTSLAVDVDRRYTRARAAGAAILRGGLPRPMAILDELRTELPAGGHVDLDPGTGEARWFLPGGQETFARERRAALESAGGFLVVEEGLPALHPWGARPASFALMERVEEAFDPHRRCQNRARTRFAPDRTD